MACGGDGGDEVIDFPLEGAVLRSQGFDLGVLLLALLCGYLCIDGLHVL